MKIVIILVNLFFIACVNADTLEQYHLTIFKNNGDQFADGTIYLPSRLEVTFSGEVKCEGVGSQFDICNLLRRNRSSLVGRKNEAPSNDAPHPTASFAGCGWA